MTGFITKVDKSPTSRTYGVAVNIPEKALTVKFSFGNLILLSQFVKPDALDAIEGPRAKPARARKPVDRLAGTELPSALARKLPKPRPKPKPKPGAEPEPEAGSKSPRPAAKAKAKATSPRPPKAQKIATTSASTSASTSTSTSASASTSTSTSAPAPAPAPAEPPMTQALVTEAITGAMLSLWQLPAASELQDASDPGYREAASFPRSLRDVGEKLDEGFYKSVGRYERDVKKVLEQTEK
jgi:outer membrane biosynthesis protein TonB